MQLDGYLFGLGLDAGWLAILDRRADQPPIAERTACAAQMSPRRATDPGGACLRGGSDMPRPILCAAGGRIGRSGRTPPDASVGALPPLPNTLRLGQSAS